MLNIAYTYSGLRGSLVKGGEVYTVGSSPLLVLRIAVSPDVVGENSIAGLRNKDNVTMVFTILAAGWLTCIGSASY